MRQKTAIPSINPLTTETYTVHYDFGLSFIFTNSLSHPLNFWGERDHFYSYKYHYKVIIKTIIIILITIMIYKIQGMG